MYKNKFRETIARIATEGYSIIESISNFLKLKKMPQIIKPKIEEFNFQSKQTPKGNIELEYIYEIYNNQLTQFKNLKVLSVVGHSHRMYINWGSILNPNGGILNVGTWTDNLQIFGEIYIEEQNENNFVTINLYNFIPNNLQLLESRKILII
jgi:hypothetical protein